MNRIDRKFLELRSRKKTAFIPFLTAGDPNLRTTEQLALAFEKAGADILELGVPFSDPMADGPTIQAASQRALKNKVTLPQILDLVRRIRRRSQMPIALMTYYNPVFRYGIARFAAQAKAAGVDGVIIPDLPPEEAKDLIISARKAGLATVFFAAPTTTRARLSTIIKASTGFIYYVSLAGVTGARSVLPLDEIAKNVRRIKSLTAKPVCVGFGVSTPAQIKVISPVTDGVIVASAIIKEIERHKGSQGLVPAVSRYAAVLARATQ